MTTTTLAPLALDAWHKELAGVAADLQGQPADIHKLMANSPELLAAWWPFRNRGVNGGALGRRKGELVILRVAARLGCWYEWGNHVDRALKIGIAIDEIHSTLESLDTSKWSASEECLLRAVDELMRDRAIGSVTLADLGRHFSTTEIMDLIAIHGMYLLLAAMIETWKLPLEHAVLARISDYTAEASFHAASLALRSC